MKIKITRRHFASAALGAAGILAGCSPRKTDPIKTLRADTPERTAALFHPRPCPPSPSRCVAASDVTSLSRIMVSPYASPDTGPGHGPYEVASLDGVSSFKGNFGCCRKSLGYIGDPPCEDGLARYFQDRLSRHSIDRIVVCVHGFEFDPQSEEDTPFNTIFQHSSVAHKHGDQPSINASSWLQTLCLEQDNDHVVLFSWYSMGDPTAGGRNTPDAKDYQKRFEIANIAAKDCAPALVSTLQAIRDARPNAEVTVLAHSLGTALTLNAVRALLPLNPSALSGIRFVFANGSAPRILRDLVLDELEETKQRLKTENVPFVAPEFFNLFNQMDRIIRVAAVVGNSVYSLYWDFFRYGDQSAPYQTRRASPRWEAPSHTLEEERCRTMVCDTNTDLQIYEMTRLGFVRSWRERLSLMLRDLFLDRPFQAIGERDAPVASSHWTAFDTDRQHLPTIDDSLALDRRTFSDENHYVILGDAAQADFTRFVLTGRIVDVKRVLAAAAESPVEGT